MPTTVNHVFTLTQLSLKQVNVQTPYCVVFKVVILVFCYVPSKSTYDRYLNLIPLYIEAIEKVQRRFILYSYSERLQKLNLQNLELRRIHYDLTLTYQIVFGLTVLKCQEFFQLSRLSTTRGHQFKLMKQQCRGYRRHFFTTRVVNIWNFLSKDVVNFSTLCSFKNSLACFYV